MTHIARMGRLYAGWMKDGRQGDWYIPGKCITAILWTWLKADCTNRAANDA